METLAEENREELARWVRAIATQLGGWRNFHTAGFIPKCRLDWAWKPGSEIVHGNMPGDEWETMDRYTRFMHERDRRKITWIAAVERNPDWSGVNKGWHVHAMWTAECEIWRTASFKRWAEQWGNNKLKSIQGDDKAVSAYLGKYVLNDLCLVHWELNGGLWHMRNEFGAA